MADTIRVGIVGATVTPGGSGWGANAHVPAPTRFPRPNWIGFCSRFRLITRPSRRSSRSSS